MNDELERFHREADLYIQQISEGFHNLYTLYAEMDMQINELNVYSDELGTRLDELATHTGKRKASPEPAPETPDEEAA